MELSQLAQELGELESREQEAVRGREMLAAEHEENGKRLEEAGGPGRFGPAPRSFAWL